MMCWLRAACVCTLAILPSACVQNPARASLAEPLRAADSFIATVEAMKHSVAPVVCLDGDGPKSTIQDLEGTAFFISGAGDFLTAAHVIDGVQNHAHSCPVTAIYLPPDHWDPESSEELLAWYPFAVANCVVERGLDVARCNPLADLSLRKESFVIRPVDFEWSSQPDGTLIAFTGFPLESRDPLTSRGGIAAYRRRSPDNLDLIIDQAAWPGASGSPVYLSDGRVVGILLARGAGDGAGTAIVRPAQSLKRFLDAGQRVTETTSARTIRFLPPAVPQPQGVASPAASSARTATGPR